MMISNYFRRNRDPTLQYVDDPRTGKNPEAPQATKVPGYNKDGTPVMRIKKEE
jgi:hypothetical protein